MSNVIEMPLPLKTTVKKILSEKFVDLYIEQCTKGNRGEKALNNAKYELQDFVITSMYLMPHNSKELYDCYRELKGDKALIEKAQIRFELQGNEDLLNKYMHILTV
jgi:hypothetical protein